MLLKVFPFILERIPESLQIIFHWLFLTPTFEPMEMSYIYIGIKWFDHDKHIMRLKICGFKSFFISSEQKIPISFNPFKVSWPCHKENSISAPKYVTMAYLAQIINHVIVLLQTYCSITYYAS